MLEPFKYSEERKSHQSFNEVYFWTSIIKAWKHLLRDDKMKMIIIESFQWLVKHKLVYIYGYVIIQPHRQLCKILLNTDFHQQNFMRQVKVGNFAEWGKEGIRLL